MAITPSPPSFTVFLRKNNQPIDRTIKAMKGKYIIGYRSEPNSKDCTNDRLPKVMAVSLHGTISYWHYALAENADECASAVPYVWKVTQVKHSKSQQHPILIVEPVILLGKKLLRNARFGALIAHSGLFPMNRIDYSVFGWDYSKLATFLEEPLETDVSSLCKTAVLLALEHEKTFEELIATLTPGK